MILCDVQKFADQRFGRLFRRLEENYCPFRGFCVDEAKKERASVRVCVQKNSEFYRGALARVTFSVSEVNIACQNFVDFAKINHCEGGSLFKRSPKTTLFDEK